MITLAVLHKGAIVFFSFSKRDLAMENSFVIFTRETGIYILTATHSICHVILQRYRSSIVHSKFT